MVVTLEQMQKTTPDALDKKIIEKVRSKSYLLEKLPFVECAGDGFTTSIFYTYSRTVLNSSTDFRKFNEDYEINNAEIENYTTELKPFGGKFSIDRQFVDIGYISRVAYETDQKLNSIIGTFNDAIINGDSAVTDSFDGLDKSVTGTDTEVTTTLDISNRAGIEVNGNAFIDELCNTIDLLDGAPTAILLNKQTLGKIRSVAREQVSYTTDYNNLGTRIEMFDNIPLIDMGDVPGTAQQVIPVNADGTSDIWFVRFAPDGFHGLKKAGSSTMIDIVYPKAENNPDSVLVGRVEMIAGCALKSTSAAAVLRGVQVQGAQGA